MRDLDLRCFDALYGGAHGVFGPAMAALSLAGGGWALLGLVPLAAWPGRPRARAFAAALAIAVAVQALLVVVLKAAAGRVRPWIALGLPAPMGAPRDPSFPSGHASGSFCVAAFLLLALPAVFPGAPARARSAGAAAIAFAAMVGVSRVYLGAHFPSDVLAGALLGACVGAAAGGLYAARERVRAAGG